MRAVSVMPQRCWVSGMQMWHLSSEVNVTGYNESGQGTGRTLIITMITSSCLFPPISFEVNLNSSREQFDQDALAHLTL